MNGRLFPHHTEDLRRSGLNDETIEALKFYSGTPAHVRAILGFDVGPGLVIPYPEVAGQNPFWRVKPDNPPIIDNKPAKYLSPKGAPVRAYIPPRTWEALKETKTPVIITEGEKKAAKAEQEVFACIGLGGIWGFSQNHQLIPDLANIKWDGRDIFLAPDSDRSNNPDIKLAMFTLERWLTKLGGSVLVIKIPPGADGSKVGLDDFLMASGSDGIKQLLQEAKSTLFWEIEDIVCLPEHKRFKPLANLFQKLADLEKIELSRWANLCKEKLGIPVSDLKVQVKVVQQQKKHFKQMTIESQSTKDEMEKARQEAEEEAAKLSPKVTALLKDPALLYRVGKVIHQLGVAGEEETIRLLYLAMTSRILNNPISITLKGESCSGKSYVVDKVCQLFPSSAYLAVTGMSRQVLVYTKESFAHRTIIIFERPGMEAADYNIRTLQSEGRIIFETVVKDPDTNEHRVQRLEKEGPTNFLFTTTAPELQPENETRHWSLLMDESPQQTLAVKLKTAKRYSGRDIYPDEELDIWRQVQTALKPMKIMIPYAEWLAKHTPDKPLRMRRDFNKLLALIEVIALLHQHQRQIKGDVLVAGFSDYFMAKELIDQVFPASLAGINKKVEALVTEVQHLYQEKLNSGEEEPVVKPLKIALALERSPSSVSRWLRPAIEAGLVEVVAETAKGRIKSVRPGFGKKPVSAALPRIEALAEAFPELAKNFAAVHPLTGEEVALEEETVVSGSKKFDAEL
jgi:hypothetical protein